MADTIKDNILKTLAGENKSAFYVFDIDILQERVRRIRAAMPPEVRLCYAVKANTFIMAELADSVDRFELCSPGEAEIFFKLGIPKEKAVISGVYKEPADIEALAADTGFTGIYTVESMSQYELLCRLAGKYRRRLKVLLRLTNDSQFGINAEDIEKIISEREAHHELELLGIQFFSGTQKSSSKKMARELSVLDGFISRLREKYGYETEELEYGTGFPAAYFGKEDWDEDVLFREFSCLLSSMKNRPRITLELGRSIAASCGSYCTHIVDIKHNGSQNYAIVDGGMHQLVYYGQYMAMKQPEFRVLGRDNAEAADKWNICGSLCTMNDIIVKQLPLPAVTAGDVLAFGNTGAYCMTEGISLFLTRDIPAVYLLKEGRAIPVRQNTKTAELNMPHYKPDIL